ncbi:unnamed protein product, partial [Adineta ricciae]
MDIRCRALYGSLLFVFFIVWILLLSEQFNESYPRIHRSIPPAEQYDYVLEPGDDICSNDGSLLLVV